MSDFEALRPTRYLHTIHAAPSCERLRQLYCSVFGGIVFSENYYAPEDHQPQHVYLGAARALRSDLAAAQ